VADRLGSRSRTVLLDGPAPPLPAQPSAGQHARLLRATSLSDPDTSIAAYSRQKNGRRKPAAA